MDNDLALEQLRALMGVAGALKMVSSQHACGAGKTPGDPDGFDQAACDAYEYPITDPRHFVLVEMTGLEGPDADGLYRATAEDGPWSLGYPVGLLRTLQKWQRTS
jgi:hypothetical protein